MNELLCERIINKIRFSELGEILRKINIPYAIIKGEPLSILAYKEEGRRHYNDIDILISKENELQIKTVLEEHGYFQSIDNRIAKIFFSSYSHQTAPFYKKLSDNYSIKIDLNFDLFWGEYDGPCININDFLSDTICWDIYGTKVNVLPPLKAFVQLALHQYKDMNSLFILATKKNIRIDMFKDIYYLLINNVDKIQLNDLYAYCKKHNIIQYVFYVLYYTEQVFKDEILSEYVRALKSQDGLNLIDYYGLSTAERKEWTVDFHTRLTTDNLYKLIEKDLTIRDKEKIALNKKVFWGE